MHMSRPTSSRAGRGRLSVAVALVLSSAMLAGCGSSGDDEAREVATGGWANIVKAAKEEGRVYLYSTKSDEDNARIIEAFEAEYPEIDAEAVRLVGGDLITRADQEIAADSLEGDVLLHSEAQWATKKADEGHVLAPQGPANDLWKGAEEEYEDGLVQVTAEPWVIGYNTDLVTTAPTDWDSLLGEKQFDKRVGLNEVTGLTVAIWFDFLDKKKPGYFDTLKGLHPRLYPNSAPLTAALSSGELAWAPYSLVSTLKPLKDSGAPVDWTIPSSGTWSIERQAMVLDSAPHPNAGLVLLDFMMSQKGQEVINQNSSGYTVAPGVKLKDGLDVDLDQIADVDYGGYGDDDLRTWQNMVREAFQS